MSSWHHEYEFPGWLYQSALISIFEKFVNLKSLVIFMMNCIAKQVHDWIKELGCRIFINMFVVPKLFRQNLSNIHAHLVNFNDLKQWLVQHLLGWVKARYSLLFVIWWWCLIILGLFHQFGINFDLKLFYPAISVFLQRFNFVT